MGPGWMDSTVWRWWVFGHVQLPAGFPVQQLRWHGGGGVGDDGCEKAVSHHSTILHSLTIRRVEWRSLALGVYSISQDWRALSWGHELTPYSVQYYCTVCRGVLGSSDLLARSCPSVTLKFRRGP
jgi:hypothetical protein